MNISSLFVQFIFFSFLGWVWESIFCTMKRKKWQDRGFLFGPVCPIYGSCVIIVELLYTYFPKLIGPERPVYILFLVSMVGSALVEYATSFVLEKRFHARWWDYSSLPLNIKGRVSLPTSTGFGLAGVLVIKFLMPSIIDIAGRIPLFLMELLAVIAALIFGADFALTEANLNSLLGIVEEYKREFNEKAEETYTVIAGTPKKVEQAIVSTPRKVEHAIVNAGSQIKEQTREQRELLSEKTREQRELFSEKTREQRELFSEKTGQLKEHLPQTPDFSKYAKRLSPAQKHVFRNMSMVPRIKGENLERVNRLKKYIEEHK